MGYSVAFLREGCDYPLHKGAAFACSGVQFRFRLFIGDFEACQIDQ
jgi:hypothetical protein